MRLIKMAKEKQEFIITNPNGTTRSIFFVGRNAWCLNTLINAGDSGITSMKNPAPRLSAYIYNCRQAGVDIETINEKHGGTYSGYHARYRLKAKIVAI